MNRVLIVGTAAAGAAGSALLLSVAAIAPIVTTAPETETVGANCMLPGDGSTAHGLSATQLRNASTIMSTGRTLKFSDQGLKVALVTGMQEATMLNLASRANPDSLNFPHDSVSAGDHDSVGIMQQRDAWGPMAVRMDVGKAATMFYTGGQGGQPGLDDIKGWESMPVWKAAQSVQVSAFPMAYAKWENLATQLVAGVKCQPTSKFVALPGKTAGERAVNAAARWLGTPYSWGGGNYDGPTKGIAQGANTVGFDCSGITMYAWYQATDGKVRLPHYTDSQAAQTRRVTRAQAQAGDLIFFTGSGEGGGTYPHMAIYDGQGGMIHAPRTGKDVERVPNVFNHPYWSGRIGMIGRPTLPGATA